MTLQRVTTEISTSDLQAIKDAFATIKQKLPFLVNLTTAERSNVELVGRRKPTNHFRG